MTEKGYFSIHAQSRQSAGVSQIAYICIYQREVVLRRWITLRNWKGETENCVKNDKALLLI